MTLENNVTALAADHDGERDGIERDNEEDEPHVACEKLAKYFQRGRRDF